MRRGARRPAWLNGGMRRSSAPLPLLNPLRDQVLVGARPAAEAAICSARARS
jgi:hypothetical protein